MWSFALELEELLDKVLLRLIRFLPNFYLSHSLETFTMEWAKLLYGILQAYLWVSHSLDNPRSYPQRVTFKALPEDGTCNFLGKEELMLFFSKNTELQLLVHQPHVSDVFATSRSAQQHGWQAAQFK
jgi:hypothetical protein